MISVTRVGRGCVSCRSTAVPGPRGVYHRARVSSGRRPSDRPRRDGARIARSAPGIGSGSTTQRGRRGAAARGIAVAPPGAPSSSSRRAPRAEVRRACGGRTSPPRRPKSRRRRQRTSTITSIGGGPGSTATRSSSWRPTWTFRARTVQPASLRRAPTRASAASPASCAVVRVRAEGWPSTVDRASRRSPGAHPACPSHLALIRRLRRRQLQRIEIREVEGRVVGHDRQDSRSRSSWVVGDAAGSPSRSRSS